MSEIRTITKKVLILTFVFFALIIFISFSGISNTYNNAIFSTLNNKTNAVNTSLQNTFTAYKQNPLNAKAPNGDLSITNALQYIAFGILSVGNIAIDTIQFIINGLGLVGNMFSLVFYLFTGFVPSLFQFSGLAFLGNVIGFGIMIVITISILWLAYWIFEDVITRILKI
mgnify:CR=1 FL=1